jgi:phenylpropionate dioxygenase-like ring-hydroxylating dioxygenase large terminal subunit
MTSKTSSETPVANGGSPLKDLRSYVQLPLLRNYWYVAGLVEEFSRELKAKTLLERSIVFYRKEDGELVALQNRCAHRSFSLSESELIGDNIRCGYHGIRYDAEGKVVDVPGQVSCPKGGVKKYAVREVGPFAWIWMGETDQANDADVPDMGGLSKPGWNTFFGAKKLDANYLLMHENLADLSHVPFLHGKTVGASPDWSFSEIGVDVETDGEQVNLWRPTSDWDVLRPFYPPGVDLAGRELTSRNGGTFVSPAMHAGWNRVELHDAAPGEQVHYDHEFNHYVTPEFHDTAHYYFSVARNCDLDNEAFDALFPQVISAAFEEDVFATKAIQTLLTEDTDESRTINITSDKAGFAVRRVILDLVKRERASRQRSADKVAT